MSGNSKLVGGVTWLSVAMIFLAGSAGLGEEGIEIASSAPPGKDWSAWAPSNGEEIEPELPRDGLRQTYNASLRLAGSVLKPRESNTEHYGGSGGGCLYATSGLTFATYNVPLTLPQGSILKYLRLYYNDTSASANSSAWLTVYDLYGVIAGEWGVSSIGSSGTGFATTAELTHEVDYASYSYVINWRPNELGAAQQVCGFRVYYDSIELFLDGFEVGDTTRWGNTVP